MHRHWGGAKCSQCVMAAVKPNHPSVGRLYCSWSCLLKGERPHIFLKDGRWHTCHAMSITAQLYVHTFSSIGDGFSYKRLADRYFKAQAFVVRLNSDITTNKRVTM